MIPKGENPEVAEDSLEYEADFEEGVEDDDSWPEWSTVREVAEALDIQPGTVRSFASQFREEHPEWFKKEKRGRHTAEHLHIDLALLAQEEFFSMVAERKEKAASEGSWPEWSTVPTIANVLDVDPVTVRSFSKRHRQKHPEWFAKKRTARGQTAEHLHADLAALIQEEFSVSSSLGPEWKTRRDLAEELGVSNTVIKKYIDAYREEHPEWFRIARTGRSGRRVEHLHPGFLSLVRAEFGEVPLADEEEKPKEALAEELGVSPHFLEKHMEPYREDHPEWFLLKRSRKNGVRCEHLRPELVVAITHDVSRVSGLQPPQEGEKTRRQLADELGISYARINAYIEESLAQHPDWIQLRRQKKKGFRTAEYLHPELAQLVTDGVANTLRTDMRDEKLRKNLESFLDEVEKDETLEAQEFRALVELFGSEQTTDILYQYRPEYKSIPLPEVRNVLSDYLGEYFVMQGGLRLESLELATGYLSNPSLKEALSEVVKRDGLKTYNRIKRERPEVDDREVLTGYARMLEHETARFENADLDEVVGQLDAYYEALFEIPKPDSLVDEIDPDRQFPDVNQRINIIELAHKNKMLIADEMGLGKSASAILAKESLGADQALVVVPSNVIDVWETYLSDERGENGEILGYFKEGQAPRVLVIDGNGFPEGIDPADYDYVIVSQEGLTEERVELLQQFDYDMMIVDEIHKLKNLSTGVRAEQLVRLAEKINGSNEKYLALLSGTPVPNKVSDVAMLLKLLYPEKFEDVPNKQLVNEIIAGDAINLRSLLLPRMELKSLTESIDMPDLAEEVHEIELSAEERELYDIFLEEDELTAAQKMQYMRQFILNPRLLDGTPGVEGTKIREVSESLRKTFVDKDKVVMFVNGYVEGVIRGDFDIFDELDLPDDVIVHVIDGSVSKRERREIENELRQPGQRVLLAVSGQTADVGVDFTAGEEVYFYNDPWTEYDKRQQLGRVFRPGHEGELVARSFYARGTIEEGIRRYIKLKYQAIEKLLRGIPTSEIEKRLLEEDEKQAGPTLEVNPELAWYYFSSWDRMLKIYGHVKEQGEAHFEKFLSDYGETYADSYRAIGDRSYQSNANRLAGALIHAFVKQRRKLKGIRIVDVASGPDMLRRHMPDRYAERVTSVDINPAHFAQQDDRHVVASYQHMPFEDNSVDYANLALSLHYTSFRPSQGDYERIEVLREMNRVLKQGGRGVISLMYTMDLRDPKGFGKAVRKLGFKIVEEYSGVAEAGDAFRARVITLEKVDDCPQDAEHLADLLGSAGRQSLKFAKSKSTLRNSRRIVTRFGFAGRDRDSHVDVDLSKGDKALYRAEQAALARMEELKDRYGEIADIPADEIISQGLSRVYNGRRYVLFQRLEGNQGAVVVK